MRKEPANQKKNNSRIFGIALGVCLSGILLAGIQGYSLSDKKKTSLRQNDAIFQTSVAQDSKKEESTLLEEVADWTEEGITSIKEAENRAEEVSAPDTQTEAPKQNMTEEQSSQEASQEEETESEVSTQMTVEEQYNYVVVGNQSVNVRKSPSTNAAKVGSVKPGTKVAVSEQTDGWCHITGKIEGYVIASALDELE